MTPEHDQELCALAPTLYKHRHSGNIQETLMPFGFECEDGWYQLIHDLSIALEKLILEKPEDERAPLLAFQVKQKYAGLRFYLVGAGTPEMEKVIQEAEKKSFTICEECGEPGATRRHGNWYVTLCETHDAAWPPKRWSAPEQKE